MLVIAEMNDHTAIQIYLGLKKNQQNQVHIVSPEEIILAKSWCHYLDDKQVISKITLQNGTELYSDNLKVVFNRLRAVYVPHFQNAKEDDKEYATMEMHALLLSWLFSLTCPVFNPVTAKGLGVHEHSLVVWSNLVQQAGLPFQGMFITTNPRHFSMRSWVPFPLDNFVLQGLASTMTPLEIQHITTQPVLFLEPAHGETCRVFVIGERIIGEAGQPYAKELRQLASMINCQLLEIHFRDFADGLKVTSVQTFPENMPDNAIDEVITLLQQYI